MSLRGMPESLRVFGIPFYVNKERNHDQNIVFDMGKVLVEYERDRVCRHFSEDEALIRKVSTAVFVSSGMAYGWIWGLFPRKKV